jgi:hypothetical protein
VHLTLTQHEKRTSGPVLIPSSAIDFQNPKYLVIAYSARCAYDEHA